jgi:hypothetical protein
MTMRNPYATHIDYSFMLGKIHSNKKVMPCNIDGVLVKDDNLLFFEWKRLNERPMGWAQSNVLKALASKSGIDVLLVIGDTDNGPNVSKVFKINPDGSQTLIGTNADDLLRIVRDWFPHGIN